MTTINTIIEEEKVEETFNYLCTVNVDEGGFMRTNGTMDSYAQALWLRRTTTTAMQRAYEQALSEYENARDDDSCECDNCHRWRKFYKSTINNKI